MNEINFNASNRSQGVDKALGAASHQKNAPADKVSPTADSLQISSVPDLSKAEAEVEEEFANLRSKFADKAESASYPALDTIDRLAQMLVGTSSKD